MDELKRLAEGSDPAAAKKGFRARAGSEGLIDIAVGSMDSPIGELHVAVTRRGLIRVLFQEESIDEEIDSLARDVSPSTPLFITSTA